ncbi:MAG: hypothetical protein IK086_06990 [Clostridia bacterium]|nr:hypothetical protein [Clostridia bacterium]
MKRRVFLVLLSALSVVIAGCNKQNNNKKSNNEEPQSTEGAHQELKVDKLDFKPGWIQTEFKKTGLKNLSISAAVNGIFYRTSDSCSQLTYRSYLFSDDNRHKDGNPDFHDTYLAVETDSGVLLKDLLVDDFYGSYSDILYAGDVTGDGTDEIILQQLIGMSGGDGQHISRIFKVVDGEIKELFYSDNAPGSMYDTGFESRFESGFKFKIFNKFTGYSVTLDLSKSERYSSRYFDETGEPYNVYSSKIMIDGFREFMIQDVNSDYNYEIVCLQYASLHDYSDQIGDVKSVLKYNADNKEFEVIESEFIPFNERNDFAVSKP